jgi:hypothetical protein
VIGGGGAASGYAPMGLSKAPAMILAIASSLAPLDSCQKQIYIGEVMLTTLLCEPTCSAGD